MVYLNYVDIVWRENNWQVISSSFMPQDMVQEKKTKDRQFKIVYNHNLKSGTPPQKKTTIEACKAHNSH